MEASNKTSSVTDYWDPGFEDLFDTVIKDLNLPNYCSEWFSKVLLYNVPKGKKARGQLTVAAFKAFKQDYTEEELTRARILGWCVELASFLVADDIMDGSEVRRGQPCWYRQEKVGNAAINDAFFLESAVYELLKKHFGDLNSHVRIMEAFHATTLATIYGQHLDLNWSNNLDYDKFTLDHFKIVAKNKTAYYSIHLPLVLGMLASGISSIEEEEKKKIEDICVEIGTAFQARDDFLDVYGDPLKTGKVGTDITEGKCTFVICTALSIASVEERVVLCNKYGSKSIENLKNVKEVFDKLDIPKHFRTYMDHQITVKLPTLLSQVGNIRVRELLKACADRLLASE